LVTPKLGQGCPRATNHRTCGTNGSLPGPQAVKLPVANSSSQYTKKISAHSESIPEEDKQFYKKLQLGYLDLSNSGDKAWGHEHMGY
jgi:hypothetical protein